MNAYQGLRETCLKCLSTTFIDSKLKIDGFLKKKSRKTIIEIKNVQFILLTKNI